MKMVALKEFRYAGKTRHAGDEFDVRDRDVRVLTAIKNAELTGLADDGQADSDDLSEPKKRIYKRRDTQAQ